MQLAYSCGVTNGSHRQLRRRENLRKLIDANGGQAQVALEIGTPKSHLSAILAGRRGVGDALAQKVEEHFGLPVGWLDEGAASPEPEFAALASDIASLPQRQRDWVMMTLREAVKLAKETVAPSDHREEAVTRSSSPKRRAA